MIVGNESDIEHGNSIVKQLVLRIEQNRMRQIVNLFDSMKVREVLIGVTDGAMRIVGRTDRHASIAAVYLGRSAVEQLDYTVPQAFSVPVDRLKKLTPEAEEGELLHLERMEYEVIGKSADGFEQLFNIGQNRLQITVPNRMNWDAGAIVNASKFYDILQDCREVGNGNVQFEVEKRDGAERLIISTERDYEKYGYKMKMGKSSLKEDLHVTFDIDHLARAVKPFSKEDSIMLRLASDFPLKMDIWVDGKGSKHEDSIVVNYFQGPLFSE